MKKSFWIIVIIPVFFFLTACGGKLDNAGRYHIKGELDWVDSGKVVVNIFHQQTKSISPIDSASIRHGKFELSGTIDSAQMVSMHVYPGNWSFDFFLENKQLELSADTTGSRYYDYTAHGYDKGAEIKKVKEVGSGNYDDIEAYLNNKEQRQYDAVVDSLGKLIDGERRDLDLQYHYRSQMDSVRILIDAIKVRQLKDYVKARPDAIAGVYLLYRFFLTADDMSVDHLAVFMNQFTGAARQSKYYQYLDEQLQKKKAVVTGAIAPDFTLLKTDSTGFTLSSTRGKYIMLDFWATWCHPCREAIPHWKDVYKKYHQKGFDIVSISNDSKWNDWTKALDVEKMPWIQVCDKFPAKHRPAKVASLYMIPYLPSYVLLDTSGKILVYSGDKSEIDHKLKEVFGF